MIFWKDEVAQSKDNILGNVMFSANLLQFHLKHGVL